MNELVAERTWKSLVRSEEGGARFGSETEEEERERE